ncbi:MAG: VWA domain-containing protein [Candidatus Omnitrophica bacterium]|jgi:Ca-activated chloride channel family protein|nr:VWA domain-containing protein [Candidatus Omnitrophota bacterium]MDD5253244.1 VWA domain-containing protein [Candidatus Omnitrophota bacterium]
MRFASPDFSFGFIVIIIILILFYFWAVKLRKAALERFAQKELLEELLSRLDYKKRFLKNCLVILAISLMFFALMRPQWGFHWEEVKRKGVDILIALDTSKSMLAEDVKPNRFERSKLAIKDLLRNLKGDRIGLIAFSGNAFLQCPLTLDYGGFLLSLDNTGIDTIPKGGTSLTSAIKEALRSYEGGQKKYKVLIVITDGEDHEGNPVEASEEAKKEGIKIFCIGIGTKEGELIPVTDESGQKIFLKDAQGNVVKSHLNEIDLQKIALNTGGVYVRATNTEFGLNLIYKERIAGMEKRELEAKMNKHYEERFQIFLWLALFLLVVEHWISDKKISRDAP